jgi:hypothetical protein
MGERTSITREGCLTVLGGGDISTFGIDGRMLGPTTRRIAATAGGNLTVDT